MKGRALRSSKDFPSEQTKYQHLTRFPRQEKSFYTKISYELSGMPYRLIEMGVLPQPEFSKFVLHSHKTQRSFRSREVPITSLSPQV